MVAVGCDVRLIKLVSSSQPMDRRSHPSTLSSSSGVQRRHPKTFEPKGEPVGAPVALSLHRWFRRKGDALEVAGIWRIEIGLIEYFAADHGQSDFRLQNRRLGHFENVL